MKPGTDSTPPDKPPVARKAGTRQVMATMFWGLLMIGRKGTWERNGATVTPMQVIVGAAVTAMVVIGLLLLLVRFAVG
jgi:hypothetical protein